MTLLLKTFTVNDMREWRPTHNPASYFGEDWEGTALDFLLQNHFDHDDRIWMALHMVDGRTAALYAVWKARQVLALVDNPDPRSMAGCDVGERYVNGQATLEEVSNAKIAAYAAFYDKNSRSDESIAFVAAYATVACIAVVAYRDNVGSHAAFAVIAAEKALRDANVSHLIKMIEGQP